MAAVAATGLRDLRHVRLLGDPILRVRTAPVTRAVVRTAAYADHKALLQETLDLFRKINGFGRGMAAPQIGYAHRLVALNVREKGRLVLLNPEIVKRSRETFTLWDDCMSFPFLMVKVRRHTQISVRFEDEDGREHLWAALPPNLSELLQHELDHLDGILAIDRALPAATVDEGDSRGILDSIVSRDYFLAHQAELARQVDYTIATDAPAAWP